MVPLIYKFIDCEIHEAREVRQSIGDRQIYGVGIRQGMPLSPLLSNVALARFDKDIEAAGIRMIRYADDLLLLFHTKIAALEGLAFVKERLLALKLTIPELSDNGKTELVHETAPRFSRPRSFTQKNSTSTLPRSRTSKSRRLGPNLRRNTASRRA